MRAGALVAVLVAAVLGPGAPAAAAPGDPDSTFGSAACSVTLNV